MENEKIAALVLALMVAGILSAYLTLQHWDDISDNLSDKEEINEVIEYGDCADVHYVLKYASNGTVISSSYATKTKEASPLNVFISLNTSEESPTNYSNYINNPFGAGENYLDFFYTPLGLKEGFIENLEGMEEGEVKETEAISAEKAFGILPKVGDEINLTEAYGKYNGNYFVLKIVEIKEDANMPAFFQQYPEFGDQPTTLYTLQEDWHNVGDVSTEYLPWVNSTVVTKIDETKGQMWMYLTPKNSTGSVYEVGSNHSFSWQEQTQVMTQTGGVLSVITQYPEDSTYIEKMNESTVSIRHNPEINSNITVNYEGVATYQYNVNFINNSKINTSFENPQTENITYRDFDATKNISRNTTRSINKPFQIFGIDQTEIPSEILERLFVGLRLSDDDFHFGCSKYAGEDVILEIEVEKIYKTSQK